MFCPNCGTSLPDGAAFCGNCGVSVAAAAVAVAATAGDVPPVAPAPSTDANDKLLDMVKAELGRDYRIERELGRGGMAVVFKGVEIALDRQVALKVVPPDNANAGQAAERFRREAKLAASLDHPNIIPVYRVGQAGPLHYMAMKFVEGRAVDSVIEQQGALPISIVVAILRYAAMGLDFAHEHKIVHRDVKPANILIDKDGRVMVSDFGIARALEEVSMTASGMMIGTPYYMSPEQCGGQKVSAQSDQYSLGVMGFQMLTGEVPFTADSMVGVIQHHYMTPVPDILAVREGVPKELLDVIYCALNKDPNDRFARTKDMATALENVPLNDRERDETESLLRQLSAGQPIPKVRTGSLPPLNLTISGPGPKIQPRPVTQPRARMTATSTTYRRRRKKKNKAVLAGLAATFAVLVSTTGYLAYDQYAAEQQRQRDSLAAAERDSVALAQRQGRVMFSGLPEGGTISVAGRVYRNGQIFTGDVGVTYAGPASAQGYRSDERFFTVRAGALDTVHIHLIKTTTQVASSAPAAAPAPVQQQAARPEPPVVVDSGEVRLSVSPLHAEIFVDDRFIGTGRKSVVLPAGDHIVKFRAPACDEEIVPIKVSPRETQLVPPVRMTCR